MEGLRKAKGALPFHMLLIGETGSGKTSFLNLMCNFNLVHKLGFDTSIEEFRAFNDISMENAEERQMESKTNDTNCYTVQFDELTIGIIDTPGFGDTRGFDEDKKNVKRIVDRIKEKEHINCICLVINSRQARITPQLKYVLSEVLPKALAKATINNLVVVLTNARDETDASFEVKELTPFLGKAISPDNVFYIDDPYLKWEKTRKKAAELGITTASKQLARNLKSAFSEASDTLASMFELVQSFEDVHTNSCMALYMVKQAVDKNALDLMVTSQNKTSLEKAISTKKKEIDEKVEAKTLNKDFLKISIFEKWVQVPTKDHNTVCSNCHVSCGLPKPCCCMNGNTCIICGHSYDSHFHVETLFQFVKEVDEGQKKKFEEPEKDVEDLSSVMKNPLDKDLRIAEEELSDLQWKSW